MHDIEEELDSAIQSAREAMPANIAALINMANSDLYSGPLYLDEDGEECSMWDEGAKPFNFSKAIDTIGDWLSVNVDSVRVQMFDTDEDGEEVSRFETIEDSERHILRALLGSELASHF
jgi:hypothetical protein